PHRFAVISGFSGASRKKLGNMPKRFWTWASSADALRVPALSPPVRPALTLPPLAAFFFRNRIAPAEKFYTCKYLASDLGRESVSPGNLGGYTWKLVYTNIAG